MTPQDRLREILRSDPITWRALQEARTLDLPDWWIVSGAVYNTVWNHLSGLPSGTGIKDIDLFYFDPDTSWEAEDRVIRLGTQHFSADPPVEIRNQARVHLWYRDHFGHPMRPIVDCSDSIGNFASETHAVGVRLTERDDITICAPFGLEAIFDMRMVPNPLNLNRKTHEAKSQRASEIWPGLTIEPWPEITIVRAHEWQDWEALLALIHRAFAFMEDRIDPPSSLNQLDAKALAKTAKAEICFLAHDGYRITGCVFCEPGEDHLYVGKLAVDPEHQGKGIGRALMDRAEAEARQLGLAFLELGTRVELTENHRTFAAMGFRKHREHAHPGFDRSTSIFMRKPL